MNYPLISIIIPVYNVEDFLYECVDSVIFQTYTNLEIILIDDGSLDNCPKICDEYAAKDKRITVIHQKNQGLSAARNAGIQIAKGEYLSFIDSDDKVHPDYINDLYKALNNSSYKVSMCKNISFINSIPAENSRNNGQKEIQLTDIFSIENAMCAWGKLFHKSLFEDILFPLQKLHEDEFVIFKILFKAGKISFCESPLYYYRTREGSIMRNKAEKFYLDFLEALTENYKYFYSLNEKKLCDIFLMRLTYLNTDYYNYCKENKIPRKKRKNISKIIVNLPKKQLSFKTVFKADIKTSIIKFKNFLG